MSTFTYRLKNVLNILVFLFLIGCGICLIVLAWALPTKSPFAILGHVSFAELIVAGTILIAVSPTPLITFLNRANLRWTFNKAWKKETLRELGYMEIESKTSPPDVESVIVEEESVNYSQAESMTQKIPDPRLQWKGQDLPSLLEVLDVNRQGDLIFPNQTGTKSEVSRQEPVPAAVDPSPFYPETVLYRQSEQLVELVECPSAVRLSAASMLEVLRPDQRGTLIFPSQSSE